MGVISQVFIKKGGFNIFSSLLHSVIQLKLLKLLLALNCKTAKTANLENHGLGVSMCRDVHLWFLFSQPPNELIN